MNINSVEKFKLLLDVFSKIYLLPAKYILPFFLNPVDAIRYVEFSYFLKFIKCNRISDFKILDISSPCIMAYLLTSAGSVTKTDINLDEDKYIKRSPKIHFKKEDATHLSFSDNTFDLVYSISAVEHMYENYLYAMKEMVRVTRLGGIIYLTFPVSEVHVEEWLDFDIYSNQYKLENKTFFQYRFDQGEVKHIIQRLETKTKILSQTIYWEREDGLYDRAVEQLRKRYRWKIINLLRNSLLHLYYGFTLLEQKPGDFCDAKSFGNIHIILEKIAV